MAVIGGSAGTIAAEIERLEPKIPILFERDDVFYSKIEKRPGEVVSEISMRMPLEIQNSPNRFIEGTVRLNNKVMNRGNV